MLNNLIKQGLLKGNRFAGAAALLSIGLVWSSFIIGRAVERSRRENLVIVKGLSERFVKADVAFWSIKLRVKDSDISPLTTKSEKTIPLVLSFLKDKLGKLSTIKSEPINIFDDFQNTSSIVNANKEGLEILEKTRYTLEMSFNVETSDVDKIDDLETELSQLTSSLGIAISSTKRYEFSKFKDARQEMLVESAKSARESAIKIVENLGAKLGKVKEANQGYFEISPKYSTENSGSYDQDKYIDKKLRVVSTVKFLLE